MKNPVKILLVDDETAILETLSILFRGQGYQVAVADSGSKALDALDQELPDIVLTDIRMPGATGLEVLARAHEVDPEMSVILMTAQASLQSAVRAVNEGAYYYLQKPFANEELLAICRRAAETRQLRVENKRLKKEIRTGKGRPAGRPIGVAPNFVAALKLAETVASTDSTVLLSGASGTGKEVVARYIHELSERTEGPFLSINCGALPEGLLESELFGHVKGSFTGAVKDKDGLLVAAAGGTFLLDEIGETSPATQVKLLRALQEREVIPVGATKPVPVHARIIAATNRDLEEGIKRGDFRSDLYYRLNVIQLRLPQLRERKEDIPLLARYFLDSRAESDGADQSMDISDAAMDALVEYGWPGNVRELENALERAAVVATGSSVTRDSLPERVREAPPTRLAAEPIADNPTMEVIERAYILWVLQAEGGNKSRAAEVLGIDPSTLYRKLNRYGIAE
ncbi:MAG: sigma-54-dependent Fis family transcriptional regulator [Gemmatimonadales bacterium]|jgi:two-component system response regulator HydG|nr:sigma-54-dependent Fis family transcriptional regulator [Gemmatimonadales bacterium]MDG2241035.1 sigma-54 dependent transcriptional regulator [Longimicrobiales bacterium]MBT3499529.1 sigma-54-dependent Fis family transcriptional regulator [Gemmatimonadales bacterium]MBT3776135.1 sigma-54-dependent Fis family transcriptional regulator [Gemmatimonadales bacterium]MBT3959368.1 sigma-54-dependent Fis family transcriptional regulator [Gemmatimonadales bacterium]